MVVFTGERTGSAGSRDAARYQHPAFSFVSPYFVESQGSHFLHVYSPTLVCNFCFCFLLSRGTNISMDWSGGTGSVGIRTGYERLLFPEIEPFSVSTDLFMRVVLFLCAKATDRARYASRIIPIRHGGGAQLAFFFLVLC